MTKEALVGELQNLICQGEQEVLSTKWILEGVIGARYRVSYDAFISWRTKVLAFLKLFLDIDNQFIVSFEALTENLYSNASSCVGILKNLTEYLEKDIIGIEEKHKLDVTNSLNLIFSRFHRVVRQLRNRHDNRDTLEVEDEYDVQDLLHALMKLYFDDIRAEEWTPSYAGKCARMDFLLKNEQVVIEVKKTRRGLGDKELGDQLIVDIERYQVHSDCKKLICFVYDPEGRIANPSGLKKDLENRGNGFVEVIIEPSV